MLKAIRNKNSNLTREDLDDILKWFSKEIKQKMTKLMYDGETFRLGDDSSHDQIYDKMIEELKNSFIESIEIEDTFITVDLVFINEKRIKELKLLSPVGFDLSKLIRLCEETNIAYKNKAFYSVGSLARIIKDHIPPIFWKITFAQVAAHTGWKSIKSNLQNLENSLKNIADDMIHWHISHKESLPNKQTVSFQADLDVLLGQIIIKLSKA